MPENENTQRRKNRSPPHPSTDLESAIARAQQLYEAEGLVDVPVTVAVQVWGYSKKSSTGIRLVAALRHYGLLDEEGSGDSRRIQISRLARKILLDERAQSDARKNAIRTAALKPKVFQHLYEKFDGELPSDANLRFYLIDEMGFNPKKVDDVIADYRDTIQFADLDGIYFGLDIGDDEKDDTPSDEPSPTQVEQAPPRASTPQEPPKMPGAGSAEMEPWDWTIPLHGGKQAVLRVPRPLSRDDFDHLRDMLSEIFPKQAKMFVEEGGGEQEDRASGDAETES